MKDNKNKVLSVCIKKAQNGEVRISVFDLMYETSLEYPDLKVELDRLVSEGELEAIDIKTYFFIGDINRELDEAKESDEIDEKLALLEKRRLELIERMKRSREELFHDAEDAYEADDTDSTDDEDDAEDEDFDKLYDSLFKKDDDDEDE